jgi:CRP-like cAMP-binding protein
MTDLKNYIDSFYPLSLNAWNDIKVLFTEKELLPNDYFIQDNQTAKHIAFLQTGLVRAFYRNSDGKEYNKHFFQFPSFIGGYSSLITGNMNKINQQALTRCTIFVADYSHFSALYNKHPDLEIAARKLAERHFVAKEDREIDLVLLDADKRYLLLQKEFPKLEQLTTQYHIASYLGISATQLSRIRKKLRSHSISLHR